jgi:uncharacterized protein (TIGR02302 family)
MTPASEFPERSERDARARRARRYIGAARLVLWWERIWPALWPALGFAGVYAILALFGVLPALPGGIHVLIVLGLCGAAFYFLWRRFASVRAPLWDEAARRLERDSRLEHRPITEGADHMAAGKGDAVSESLWHAHMIRLFASANRLRLRPPSPGLGRDDRYFLRFLVLAGVIGGIVFAGGDWWNRLAGGFAPVIGARTQAVVTAWVSPPAYTGRAPLSLDPARREGALSAPQHSMLVIRVSGTQSQPSLHVRPTPQHAAPDFTRIASGYEVRIALESDAEVSVKLGAHTLADWTFAVQRDRVPAIVFSEPPQSSAHEALKLAYHATDDYGVVKIEAHIVAVDDAARGAANAGTLVVPLSAPPSSKDVAETVYRDLTAHAYAGLKVAITLVAIDGSGQVGKSQPAVVTLPERVFTQPLAKALIEQRKALALALPNALRRATIVVDALTIAPERFYKDDYSTYLAMRALFYELEGAKDERGVKEAMAMMWDIAVAVEEGDLANAADELRRAQEQLMSALERGAPDGEIDALLDKLRQAMARYLEAMAQNAPQNGNPPAAQNAMTISPQDLAALLKAIQDLARTGARDQARQMLAALAQLMENLRMSGAASPTENAMTDALRGLSDLMGNQRQLLDRTFRAEQGQGPSTGLAPDQQALRDRLNKVIEGLQQKGVQPPQGLGRAGQAMQDAQGNLTGGQLGSAEQSQQNAIEQLREGAQALAKELMASGAERNGAPGAGEDPLGRPTGARGSMLNGAVKVPNESDLQRARAILDELRRRAGERSRTQEELDYIERLLKQF